MAAEPYTAYNMPNNTGIGYADYVLFDDDGTPLAVIEAKRSSVDPAKGRHQAELYAECLKNKYACELPVIYYSNGFGNKHHRRSGLSLASFDGLSYS